MLPCTIGDRNLKYAKADIAPCSLQRIVVVTTLNDHSELSLTKAVGTFLTKVFGISASVRPASSHGLFTGLMDTFG